jgi:tetraacyldisaccharide 4'-kinase
LTFTGDYFRAIVSGRERGWRASLGRGGLCLASWPYAGAVRLRNWLYDQGWAASWRVPVPVVSVGNLTLGGTGKTPCVEYVARWYHQRHLRVGLLSRGYGTSAGPNDEALVLEENLPDVPHWQGADRAALARSAIGEDGSDLLILDDGFQHRRLHRDLDLALVDGTDPWGQGRIFPRGLLREPPSVLRRADLVLLTRCDQVEADRLARLRDEVACAAPGVPIVETVHRPVALRDSAGKESAPELLAGRKVAAFCGIGNPDAFRGTLAALGARVAAFRTFSDHHAYTGADVASLDAWLARQAPECVAVTTQKDLVKLRLPRLGGLPLWGLRIALEVRAGADVLDRTLGSVLPGGPAERIKDDQAARPARAENV